MDGLIGADIDEDLPVTWFQEYLDTESRLWGGGGREGGERGRGGGMGREEGGGREGERGRGREGRGERKGEGGREGACPN